jgi:hypothetical protein
MPMLFRYSPTFLGAAHQLTPETGLTATRTQNDDAIRGPHALACRQDEDGVDLGLDQALTELCCHQRKGHDR